MAENLKVFNNWHLKGLGADSPRSELKEKLTLFGQFVGDWEIVEARYMQADGSWVKMRGEVHFGWILEGTALQDVWIGYKSGSKELTVFGTTIRFYDPNIDAWRSTWLSPLKRIVRTFIARKVKDEIVLEETHSDGFSEKWIFSEITPNSFRWHSEEMHDNRNTWILTEEMQICRI